MRACLVAACVALSSLSSTGILPLVATTGRAIAVEEVLSTMTPITGGSDLMISYRQQRHMWLSNDGAIHTLINQGENGNHQALTLYSSFDQGNSWNLMLTIANTNSNSISDGFLFGRKLYAVYSSADGKVYYQTFSYNPQQKSWATDSANLVFASQTGTVASNPTLMMDRNRNLWVAFVGKNKSNQSFIRLYGSEDAGTSWIDTGINFGAVSTSMRKSPVLVNFQDRIGLVFTNDDSLHWAYRLNSAAMNAAWQTELITTLPSGSSSDPYASHFSVVTDQAQNLHLVTRSGGRLMYLRYNQVTQAWDTPRYLTSDVNVGYMQIAVTLDDQLLVVCNQGGGSNLILLRSSDHGTTFTSTTKLFPNQQDLANFSSVDMSHPRMEMPSVVDNYLPIVQQFVADGVQRLMYFKVDL